MIEIIFYEDFNWELDTDKLTTKQQAQWIGLSVCIQEQLDAQMMGWV